MANHCDNFLVIRGSKRQIDELVALLMEVDINKIDLKMLDYGAPLYFNKILPDPQFWGVKYGLDDHDWDRIDNDLIYNFFTSWGPPIELLYYISIRFPELIIDIKYYEPGTSLLGNAEIFAGKIKDRVYNYNTERETYLDFVEEYFNENIRYY